MPGRRSREESDIMDTDTAPSTIQPITATRSVRRLRRQGPPSVPPSRYPVGPPGYPGYEYVRPADRLQTVENDPNLLAMPSAHFAQRAWMLANSHAQTLEQEWQKVKLFYITMTDFAKLQKQLDREVNPMEVPLGPWVAMMKENMTIHIANNRMSHDCLIQFELLHASLRMRIGEGRGTEVKKSMAAMQALFTHHAKLWLDYNACIPVQYRMKMGDLYPWLMKKWVLHATDGLEPEVGFFRREAVPEIMDHLVTVYCESQ